jgi:solute carrier family 25 carnitine/acylcarnitine transporter 20/29
MTEYLYGGLSGMFGIVVSHPVDTIKSIIQSGNKVSRNDLSITRLYKGIIPPLIGVGFEKAIVFGTQHYIEKYFQDNKYNNRLGYFLSGMGSGFVASAIVTPYERFKILYQTNEKNIMKNMSLRSLYRGFSATLTRETPGFAIYFSVYKNIEYEFYVKKGQVIPSQISFLSGGLSGAIAWVFIYPQDLIKTKMQASLSSKKSFIEIFREIGKDGIRHFYKGFHFALYRAVALHSSTFFMYDYITNKRT